MLFFKIVDYIATHPTAYIWLKIVTVVLTAVNLFLYYILYTGEEE